MTTTCHLDDEHMCFYEWSGTTGGAVLPAARTRRHPWHASYAVLALLTSLLIMQGCDDKGPAERAGEDVDRAMQDLRNAPGPAEEAGRALDDARETTGEKIEQMGKDLQEP
ncbi:MAG: hypothetical protein Q8R61_02750 [Thiobacillus sp.]|uniref:hypothetical protein n=1 Tax=Thiobacillus sp. TaxID=924 RepID=UPI002736CA59|nr:hypothetical protein [Thiobacillus sp.]MDP3584016.1 hypothetical protein [Thiobacillus sp.]